MIQNQRYELIFSEQPGMLSDELGAMPVKDFQDLIPKLWVEGKLLNLGCW